MTERSEDPVRSDPREVDPSWPDARARAAIRTALDRSLLVEAAAGTGKTTELIKRIVATLERGLATINGVVAVTFTRKAAGELKLRLRQELDLARARTSDPAARAHLEAAVAHLEEARIGTIHSFCAEILRARPVEAEVDPRFVELSESEAPRLFDRVFRRFVEQKLGDLPPGLRRALGRASGPGASDRSPLDGLRDAAFRLIEWRDHPAPWRRPPFDRDAEVHRLIPVVHELSDLATKTRASFDPLRSALDPAVRVSTWIRRAQLESALDLDVLEGLLVRLVSDLSRNTRLGRSNMYAENLPRAAVVDARERVIGELDAFRRRADADLAAVLQTELGELIERYEERKRKSGKLDFVDLLIKVRDLVRDRAPVRAWLQQRFTHIFVDEFQDTDPLQTEILLLLSADDPAESRWREVRPAPGKLFLVGDPKQSIYRFRRADVLLYESVKTDLVARGVEVLELSKSFRATSEIQEAINAAFAPEMTGDPDIGQASYVPLNPHRAPAPTQPAVIALPIPRPYGRYDISKKEIDACLPDTVAALIEWLLKESGFTVRDPEDKSSSGPERRVPIEERHIAVLFRRFTAFRRDVTRDYLRALEARNIPHLLVGARSFFQREEVEALQAALTAIEWPDDDLSVFATLRGPLFSFPDSALFRYREKVHGFSPFRRAPENLDADLEPVVAALRVIAGLHQARNRRPIVETIGKLLAATRAQAGFAFRPAGNQVLASVERVLDLARGFELGGGLSFRGFVEHLIAESEKERSEEAPVLEEGAQGVRMMTVHAAKGLEFPVVILADPSCNLSHAEPDKHVDAKTRLAAMRLFGCAPWDLIDHATEETDRDGAEGVRLAYVAATRAKDLLVVPALGDGAALRESWISPLDKAIYPPRARWRAPEPAPGCPPFGKVTVLARPVDRYEPLETSIQPGLHRAENGAHGVVFWDPLALRLGVPSHFGLRAENVLAEDPEGVTAKAAAARHRAWSEERDRIVSEGARKEIDILAPSLATAAPTGFVVRIERSSARAPDTASPRPTGRRFGALVHHVLREVPLDASSDAVRRIAEMMGRALGASPEEVVEAVNAVGAALAHPVLARARTAAQIHRELPFHYPLDDGRILEGAVDLAFLEDGTWIVVELKTGADAEKHAQAHERQLGWYLFAISRLFSAPAKGVLLTV